MFKSFKKSERKPVTLVTYIVTERLTFVLLEGRPSQDPLARVVFASPCRLRLGTNCRRRNCGEGMGSVYDWNPFEEG